jgi:hypothetical protein
MMKQIEHKSTQTVFLKHTEKAQPQNREKHQRTQKTAAYILIRAAAFISLP